MIADILEQARAIRASMDAAAAVLTDAQAVNAPLLYPKWSVGITVEAGDRIYYEGTKRLYRVNSGMGHTTQADWTPDATPAMFTVIDIDHTGTQDDPIPAVRGMEYTYGLYYTDPEDSKVYLCQRTGESSGGKITLQYLPHELLGQYFELADGGMSPLK